MDQKKLNTIATIQTGFSFRSGLSSTKDGIPVVQLKDIQNNGTVTVGALSRVTDEGFRDAHLLSSGDLVFRSRGQQFTMAVIPEIDSRLVLSAPLFKISIDRSTAIPEYIAWYVNSIEGQAYLESVSEGSSIKMISKVSLSEMMIPLPPISVQQSIAGLSQLTFREKELSILLLKKREHFINARIQRYLQEA